jgi:hypothetical protein
MHAIIGTSTNQDETWFNECSVDAEREDPGGISDPDLPLQPPAEAVTGCVSGTGPSSPSDFAGHCAFTCSYDVYPDRCTCPDTGIAKTPPASDGTIGSALPGEPGATDILYEW